MMSIIDKSILDWYFRLYKEKEKKQKVEGEEEWGNTREEKQEVEDESTEVSNELDDIIWEFKDKTRDLNLGWYNELYDSISHLIPSFVRKLNSIIKDNSYNRNGGAFRSWKLNTWKLYKVVLNDTKLFTRKLNRQHKDYVVSLLVDNSWSMYWWKDIIALKSTILLSEVLHRVWIPFEVIGFNLDYIEYKTIKEKFDYKVKNRLLEFLRNNSWNSWNNDWYAIRKANHSLKVSSNSSTERTLLVLSDWQPTPSGSKLSEREQKLFKLDTYDGFNLLKEVSKASLITKVIGIGIQDHSVEQYYRDNIVVNNINLLPQILLNKLKTNIKRW